MSALEAALFLASGEPQGKVELPETLFSDPGSRRTLQETIIALQRNQRRGTSETKTRGNVTGGGHKPWKQKGTGNARAGTIRSPLWRKGGIIFGPHPRSYRVELNQAKKTLALRTALVEKAKAQQIGVIESLTFEKGKTSEAALFLKKTGMTGRILLVLDKREPKLLKPLRNLAGLECRAVSDVNAWNLLAAHQILFTRSALDRLAQRISEN